MLISKVLNGVRSKNSYVSDYEISDICFDSRQAKEGCMFVCMKWMDIDAHLYVKAAVENGAKVIVAEDVIDVDCDVVYVEDSKTAFSTIASNFYGNPANNLKLIGVTGTNGKTSTTCLIKSILEYCGKKVGLIGTNQNLIGNIEVPAHNTTPFASELHALLRDMVDGGVEYVVMEVASHALELKRVAGLHFEVAGYTNLTQDHLDFHHDMESYFAAKKKIAPMSGRLVINVDDQYGNVFNKENKGMTRSYGIDKDADLKALNVRLSERGIIFDLEYNGVMHEIKLQIPGRFSVYNALCAIGICLEVGMDIEDIKRGLMLIRGVKGRAEVVRTNTDYVVMIDYAHTPDGLVNIISTVCEFAKGRVITLFGCGGDRDPIKRPIMGRIAGELSDYCIVTSDNPRTEEPNSIINEVVEGIKNTDCKYDVIENRKEAIAHALAIAESGDVIILAGKGHETYQILGKTKIDFDERKIVQGLLEKK